MPEQRSNRSGNSGTTGGNGFATEHTTPRAIARPAVSPQPRPRVSVVKPVTILEVQPCGDPACKTLHALRSAPDATLIGHWLMIDRFDSRFARRPDYGPHPHVGMAALAYLFDGRIVHADSLGNNEVIEEGCLAWFHAGRGALHSSRHPADARRDAPLHGLELWVALPMTNENDAPSFALHRAVDLPSVWVGGARVRVVLGRGFGVSSPVATPMPLAMFDIRLASTMSIALPTLGDQNFQRAVYVVSGTVTIADRIARPHQLAMIAPDVPVSLRSDVGPAHVIMLGSAACVGPRYTWWQFVSSSRQGLAQARSRYVAGELGAMAEPSIPLPHYLQPL